MNYNKTSAPLRKTELVSITICSFSIKRYFIAASAAPILGFVQPKNAKGQDKMNTYPSIWIRLNFGAIDHHLIPRFVLEPPQSFLHASGIEAYSYHP